MNDMLDQREHEKPSITVLQEKVQAVSEAKEAVRMSVEQIAYLLEQIQTVSRETLSELVPRHSGN